MPTVLAAATTILSTRTIFLTQAGGAF